MKLVETFRSVSFLDLSIGFGSDWQTEGSMDALEANQTPMGSTQKIEGHDMDAFMVGHGVSFPKWPEPTEKAKGGKRPGSGRKALDDEPTVVTTIRLTAKQKTKLENLGGAKWIRSQLEMF